MKKLYLFCITMLLSLWATKGTAASANDLRMDTIHVRGNMMAMMAQYIEVSVNNTSTDVYQGRWYVVATHTETGVKTCCLDTLVTLPPKKKTVCGLYCPLPEGPLWVQVATDAEASEPLADNFVTIRPLERLHFYAMLSLDMLSADGMLYDNKVHGTVTVRNDDAPYYGVKGGRTDDDGLFVWLEDAATGTVLARQHLGNALLSSQSISTTFDFTSAFKENGDYVLKVGYAVPGGMETIQSLNFTMCTTTNTYWTAEGQVLPLPVSDNRLQVPAEAVAVDLRGQCALDAAYPIEVSQANPNCLYYLSMLGSLPEGLDDSRNIIRGQEAVTIRLTEDNDYYCPMAFKAHIISYMMTPSYDNPDDAMRARGYSETLVLPFDVSHASLYDVNDDSEMQHADLLKVLQYLGNYGDSLNVRELSTVRQMKAYVPYVLGVYVGSRLLFAGVDTQVPVTRQAIVHGQGVNFIGTTVACQPQAQVFLYDAEEACFHRQQARIAPFHAYMDMDDSVMSGAFSSLFIADSSWGDKGNPSHTDAVSSVTRSDERTVQDVYDVYGRRWSQSSRHHHPLPKGIYIVGGRKIIVR